MTDAQIKTVAERTWRETFYASDPEKRTRLESVRVAIREPLRISPGETVTCSTAPVARVEFDSKGLALRVIR